MNTNGIVHAHSAPYHNTLEIEHAVEKLLFAMPAFTALTPQSKVVLKPNLLSKSKPEKAITTHPDVVRGVILALQKQGVQNILVADSPGGRYTPEIMKAVYQESGIAKVCAQLGVPVYTECQSTTIKGNGKLVKSFDVLLPIANCDVVLNLPKMKTHVMTGMSGAVKNLFGCVPGLHKAEFHTRFPEKEHFAQMLLDLQHTLPPQIHLVDGILAMEGDGPGGGIPRECNLLFASENPYFLDLTLAHYMNLTLAEMPVLVAANSNNIAPLKFDSAWLQLQSNNSIFPFQNYKKPRSYQGNLNFEGNVPAFLRPLFSAVTKAAAPRPKINKPACIGCGKCAEICPQHVIHIQNKKASIAYKNCIRCFCCHEVCPVKAIDVKQNKLFNL